jgi:hypothetical protein
MPRLGCIHGLWRISPRRVGDDVTVLSEQRLNHTQDSWMRNGFLANSISVQHFITKLRILCCSAIHLANIGRISIKHRIHRRTKIADLRRREHPLDEATTQLL